MLCTLLVGFVSATLQLHCKVTLLSWDVVCLSSVTRVYCDKTAEAKIMQFWLKCSPMPYLFACQAWLRNLKGFHMIGLKLAWGGFWLRDAISRRRCEIELRWQLITDRLSFSIMTLNVRVHCSVIRVMRVLTKLLKLESRGFRSKVALYFSYLHIRFDDEIEGNPFEFQAYTLNRLCRKLNCRLGLALFAARCCSYLDL